MEGRVEHGAAGRDDAAGQRRAAGQERAVGRHGLVVAAARPPVGARGLQHAHLTRRRTSRLGLG